MTKIEWTDEVWNPVTGCSKVSEGCKNCYAERFSHRFGWTKKPWTVGNAEENVKLHPERLEQPLRWRKPRKIFVNSMSDLFHEQVPFEFIDKVFAVMALSPKHTFQILTKRPKRMLEYFKSVDERARYFTALPNRSVDYESGRICELLRNSTPGTPPIDRKWPLSNVWIGVSVENQKVADERIPLLLQTPATIRFLSLEPLLGPIDLSGYKPFDGECFCQDKTVGCKPRLANDCPESAVDWVIVGGESGPRARPMHPDWVRSLRDQCQQAGVPFFFKQWGGKKKAGRLLDGEEWNELPRR